MNYILYTWGSAFSSVNVATYFTNTIATLYHITCAPMGGYLCFLDFPLYSFACSSLLQSQNTIRCISFHTSRYLYVTQQFSGIKMEVSVAGGNCFVYMRKLIVLIWHFLDCVRKSWLSIG